MRKIFLFAASLVLMQLLQNCSKETNDTPIIPTPEPSKVTVGRFAIEEFWPLSEGQIEETNKTITIKVPYWAKLSELSVYSQLNLGTENPASVTITPSLAGNIDFSNLKSIKITDGQGKKAEYTLKIVRADLKLVNTIKGEDEFNFAYDSKGKMIQVKAFNEKVNAAKTYTQNISYDANELISLSTQNSPLGQVYTSKDNNSTIWLHPDARKRINNLVYLGEETVRLEYDIVNNKVVLYFRTNPMGGNENATRKITFSDFDGNFSPMATLPLQETYWSVNTIYAFYYYFYNAPASIAPKLLLSNPKNILIEELWGDKKSTSYTINYEYQNNMPVKYTSENKSTIISYQ